MIRLMKKTAILAAAAAMVLAACAKIDTVPTGTTPASQKDLAITMPSSKLPALASSPSNRPAGTTRASSPTSCTTRK